MLIRSFKFSSKVSLSLKLFFELYYLFMEINVENIGLYVDIQYIINLKLIDIFKVFN